MIKKAVVLGLAGMLGIPGVANAVQVVGEKLEVYLKAHVSLDFSDPDNPAADNQTGLSSNDSYIGFKGKRKMENDAIDLTVLYQLEQEVDIDETGGQFATRNSFIGVENGFGTVLVGHHDTPFKDVAKKFDLFNETVGDRRAILGASATDGNKMNDRGENMIMYKNVIGLTEVRVMHSFSNPTDETGGSLDNNDNDMTSLGVFYNDGPLSMAGGYESWSDLLDDNNSEVSGLRLTGAYSFDNTAMGSIRVGLIFESTSSDDAAQWDRNAYGINGTMDIGNNTSLNAQILLADDYDGVSDSGAIMTSIGIFRQLEEKTEVYAVFTTTSNDNNARFQGVDGGHGDEINTVNGGNPNALSFGFIHAI